MVLNMTDLIDGVEDEMLEEIESYSTMTQQYELLERIFLELFTIVAILSVAANIVIASVIIKFAKLRQDKSNFIILSWIVINSILMIYLPISTRIPLDFLYNNRITYCFVEQLLITLILGQILFMTILTIYWYLKLYNLNCFNKFNDKCMYLIIIVHVFIWLCLGFLVIACYNRIMHNIGLDLVFFSYIAYIVFMIIINIMHAIKKRRLADFKLTNNVPILISNTYFLSTVPFLLSEFCTMWMTSILVVVGTTSTAQLIYAANSIYFTIILYTYSNDFNIFFKHLLKCRCYKYPDVLIEQTVVYDNV